MEFDNIHPMLCGPNDGGIKRGDRADTGDDQAGHKDGVSEAGSGVPGGSGGSTGNPTAATDSLAEPVDRNWLESEDVIEPDGDIDDLYVTDKDDPALVMTNTGDRPLEDWAANTGPTATPEGEREEIQNPPLEPKRAGRSGKRRKAG